MKRIVFFLSLSLPPLAMASHWESTPWVKLEVAAKAPDPFGLLTFKFEIGKDGKLSSYTVQKGGQVREVPSIYYSKLEYPQLNSIEIINDAGISVVDESEGGRIYFGNSTSILSVHLYYGEPMKGSDSYPYLACTFLATGELDSCETHP